MISTLTSVQQAVAIIASALLVLVVVSLIYRQKLREDYGALWLVAACLALLFAIWQDGLRSIAALFGSVTLTAPVFLLAIMFLTVVAVHYSVRLSEHERRLRRLAQELALRGVESPSETAPITPAAPSGGTSGKEPPTTTSPG